MAYFGRLFNENYLKATMIVAEINPGIKFYSYTKSLNYLKDIFIPNNFKLTLSYGGKYDSLINELDVKHVKVFYSEIDAERENYQIDHDDSLAYSQNNNFGLLIHGSQKANTFASEAWQKIKNTVGGYSKKNKKI